MMCFGSSVVANAACGIDGFHCRICRLGNTLSTTSTAAAIRRAP